MLCTWQSAAACRAVQLHRSGRHKPVHSFMLLALVSFLRTMRGSSAFGLAAPGVLSISSRVCASYLHSKTGLRRSQGEIVSTQLPVSARCRASFYFDCANTHALDCGRLLRQLHVAMLAMRLLQATESGPATFHTTEATCGSAAKPRFSRDLPPQQACG